MNYKKGDLLEIIKMNGEPQYNGAKGYILHIDDMGQIHGTWGGCAVIPAEDEYEVTPLNYFLKEGYGAATLSKQLKQYEETQFYKFIIEDDYDGYTLDAVLKDLLLEINFYSKHQEEQDYKKWYEENLAIKESIYALIDWERSEDVLNLFKGLNAATGA